MKTLGTVLTLAAAAMLQAVPAAAQMPRFELKAIDRPAQADAIPLYPAGTLPKATVPESWARLIGHFPDGSTMDARIARNVAEPTMTPVLPDPAKATGAAVVVAPGGAFLSLSMDSEGFDVARRLADRGIAAFVLKYRLNPTPADNDAFMRVVGERMGAAIRDRATAGIDEPRAYQDALQALKLVRAGGARWHVDPARVGIIGFSAGAMTALQSVLTGQKETRPGFVGFIYGPMLPVTVPPGAPPLFAALALDDPLFGRQGFGVVEAWRKAGVPVEFHAYERGDHGFGVGKPGTTTTEVIPGFIAWMTMHGWLKAAR